MSKASYVLLSLNPGYDRWLEISHPSAFERVYRADSVRVVASGKGINVARCFTRMGFHDYTGLCIAGGQTGALLDRAIKGEGLRLETFFIEEETRVNVTALMTYRQDTLTLNESGPRIRPEETQGFFKEYERMLGENGGARVVVSGSAPVGFDTDDYLRLIDTARGLGHRLIIDIGGQWLIDSVKGPVDTLKINREEFMQAFQFDGFADPGRALGFSRDHRIDTLVITDGVRGAVAADAARGTWRARFDPSRSGAYAVGSGDSFLAGYLIARAKGDDLAGSLREATAFGMANSLKLEPAMIDAADVESARRHVTVEESESAAAQSF